MLNEIASGNGELSSEDKRYHEVCDVEEWAATQKKQLQGAGRVPRKSWPAVVRVKDYSGAYLDRQSALEHTGGFAKDYHSSPATQTAPP